MVRRNTQYTNSSYNDVYDSEISEDTDEENDVLNEPIEDEESEIQEDEEKKKKKENTSNKFKWDRSSIRSATKSILSKNSSNAKT